MAALGLGALGALLPLLPTTPFVLLAVACFSKGAPEWRTRLLNNAVVAQAYDDWSKHRAIPVRAKQIAVTMMVSTVLVSAVVDVAAWLLTVQAICLLAVSVYVLSRPNGSSTLKVRCNGSA